jgi:beta-lactamase class A
MVAMKQIILWVVILGAGLALGMLLQAHNDKDITQTEATACAGEFINPLRCDNNTWRVKKDYADFVSDLKDYIQKEEINHDITIASVYFRDLDGGPVFFLNEDEKFTPASLLKVPVMMAYFKYAETEDKGVLDQRVTYTGQLAGSTEQSVKPQETLKVGQSYTVAELINTMIVDSDNRSMELLLSHMEALGKDGSPAINTLKDLGLVEATTKADDFLDVKTYASLFRILYNASYLTPEMSNKALEILAQAKYDQGLVAGVPSGIKVAHKFGERSYADGVEQLHDCGIVYHPKTHYLLCVMTRGTDKTKLPRVISEISKKIFNAAGSRTAAVR